MLDGIRTCFVARTITRYHLSFSHAFIFHYYWVSL